MNAYETFTEYWEQAVNALAYRIRHESSVILTQKQIRAIWQEELLTKRFRSEGMKHGARVFLDGLEQSDPTLAKRVLCQLMLSEMPIGANGNVLVGEAAATAVLGAAACKLGAAAKAVSLIAGSVLALKTAKDAMQGTKNNMISALNAESARQLAQFAVLFGEADM
ncbi:MAG: hypothetical protein E7604_07360 [Ruminococcaceae bacterium]|nr:hypothetical protein [Oscillospiraceae bacterium]